MPVLTRSAAERRTAWGKASAAQQHPEGHTPDTLERIADELLIAHRTSNSDGCWTATQRQRALFLELPLGEDIHRVSFSRTASGLRELA